MKKKKPNLNMNPALARELGIKIGFEEGRKQGVREGFEAYNTLSLMAFEAARDEMKDSTGKRFLSLENGAAFFKRYVAHLQQMVDEDWGQDAVKLADALKEDSKSGTHHLSSAEAEMNAANEIADLTEYKWTQLADQYDAAAARWKDRQQKKG